MDEGQFFVAEQMDDKQPIPTRTGLKEYYYAENKAQAALLCANKHLREEPLTSVGSNSQIVYSGDYIYILRPLQPWEIWIVDTEPRAHLAHLN